MADKKDVTKLPPAEREKLRTQAIAAASPYIPAYLEAIQERNQFVETTIKAIQAREPDAPKKLDRLGISGYLNPKEREDLRGYEHKMDRREGIVKDAIFKVFIKDDFDFSNVFDGLDEEEFDRRLSNRVFISKIMEGIRNPQQTKEPSQGPKPTPLGNTGLQPNVGNPSK